jgi:hypothetical protein
MAVVLKPVDDAPVKWLETFVNGGTAQIMAIAEDVQKLRKTLGNIDELHGDLEGPGDADADAGAGHMETRTFTLLQGIRRLAEESKQRDRDSAHLLGTVNGLVAALNEDMRKNAEMRNTYCKPQAKRHPFFSCDTMCSKMEYSSH